MDQAKKILREKTAILDNIGNRVIPIQDFAKAIDVNPGTIVAGFLFLVSLFMLLFHGLAIFVTALTVVYPGLMSIRAIETEQKDDDKYWLTYWMIFG